MAVNTYTVAEVVSAAAQTEIIAQVQALEDLIGGSAADGGFTDGDQISPQLQDQLTTEFAALKAAIEAAPTA